MSLILTPDCVWARPPSGIQLEYDQEKEILRVELDHRSEDPQEHYIRRLFISRNDSEPVKFSYSAQTNPQKLIQDVSMKLDPEDQVTILAVCSEAGRKEQAFVMSSDGQFSSQKEGERKDASKAAEKTKGY